MSANRPKPDVWVDAVLDQVVEHLAASGELFSADDCWRPLYGLDPEALKRGELGAAFQRAHTAGLIRPVGVQTSRRRSRHGALIRVWRGNASARDTPQATLRDTARAASATAA